MLQKEELVSLQEHAQALEREKREIQERLWSFERYVPLSIIYFIELFFDVDFTM